jgi:hypothetical protein
MEFAVEAQKLLGVSLHSIILSLQYSNLTYAAPVHFHAHRNIFSQSVQYWTETFPASA